MTFTELKDNLSYMYRDFFDDMKIDSKTGIVIGNNLRFTGFPYIGRNYVTAPIKLLFVPLDTGKDECFKNNTYHSFKDREDIFPTGMLDFNPHIAGMYATALYILREKMGYEAAWDILWSYRNYTTAKAIKMCEDSLPQDLMSYIAYENRFRFVTVGRGFDEEGNEIRERGGNKDRRWINPQRESEMLLSEIDAFSPDIIVFQGKDGLWNCNINKLKNKYKVVVAYHPSCWQRKADRLQYVVEHIGSQL